jgi:hypothetical protein
MLNHDAFRIKALIVYFITPTQYQTHYLNYWFVSHQANSQGQSQSQSHITTDSQSACSLWYQAHIWDPDQFLLSPRNCL